MAERFSRFSIKGLWFGSVLLALTLRLPGLWDQSYYWRELQTEMTTFWFQKEGIDLIHYQTPIYGPPWQIPFEFPLYQAASALVARVGIGSLEFASRLTALFCFSLSAFFLYLLCREIFGNAAATFLIVSLYLWTPYNIYYSEVPQIDYLSVALALAYLNFAIRWLRVSSSIWFLFSAVIAGSLLVLVKPTTAPIALFPIVVYTIQHVLLRLKLYPVWPSVRLLLSRVWNDRGHLIALFAMFFIPVAVGAVWTHHSDQVKVDSLFTRWLTSYNSTAWIYGTLELRTNPEVWIEHINTAIRFLWPYGLSILSLLGLFGILGILQGRRQPEEVVLFIGSMAGGIAITLIIFLHLYLHEYYYIALSAPMAILGGYGMAWFWEIRHIMGRPHLYVFGAIATIVMYGNASDYLLFRNFAAIRNAERASTMQWSRQVQLYVPADQWVVFVENDWDPSVPYLLERKTMVVTERETDMPICSILEDPKFALVVILDRTDPTNLKNLDRVLRCFGSEVEVMPGVYQVAH